jgi:hypothetical protein
MKEYLLETDEWLESDITVLTDAKGTPEHLLPTYDNIVGSSPSSTPAIPLTIPIPL